MVNYKKMLMSAAGAGGEGLDVSDVYHTSYWEGTGSSRSIVNGIDLSTEGGAVWIKYLTSTSYKQLMQDTVATGTSGYLQLNSGADEQSTSDRITAFNNNGYSLGTNNEVNQDTAMYAGYTFRRAPNFFDVIEYTGNGSNRTIAHNLGTTPGFYIVKKLDGNFEYDWYIYHRSLGATKYMRFNETDNAYSNSSYWNDTEPTSSVFSVGTSNAVNMSGAKYICMLWAHNNSDGGFGTDADQDIIKCDKYTGNGSNDGPTINLGFEPQWLLIKPIYGQGWQTNIEDWIILDIKGGITLNSSGSYNNTDYWWNNNKNTNSKKSGDRISLTATGFKLDSSNAQFNYSGREYLYVAIRRGPIKPPTSASSVFDIDTRGGHSPADPPAFRTTFDPDFAFRGVPSAAFAATRLTQGGYLDITTTGLFQTSSSYNFSYDKGWWNNSSTSTSDFSYMWGRAPEFFDVVNYTGNGTAGRTVTHNLGKKPEMIWVWRLSHTQNRYVYHAGVDNGATDVTMGLDTDLSVADFGDFDFMNGTQPTSSVFSLSNTAANINGYKYIAMLFCSLDGIAKVGSYTGNGSSQNIDCGFSNGSKLVIIKPSSASGGWHLYDTSRTNGLVASTDVSFELDTASSYSADAIDPLNSGFTVNSTGNLLNGLNVNYIFYAIAA